MSASVFKSGNTAVITGGASGIGLALAQKCHGYGMKVIVADKNEEDVALASKTLATVQMDVGRLEDWDKLKNKVDEEFGGRVDLLALNAGYGIASPWTDPASFRATFDTNFFGIINGISTFLPSVIKSSATTATATASNPSSSSAIIITGSKQGITNPPGDRPAYNASKAAVKTVAEHLSYDLRDEHVGVHLLVPGWTWTGLMGNRPGKPTEKSEGAWTAGQVVDYLEQKMGENKFYVICPDDHVTEDLDRKRMLWGAQDVIEGRPPLTRWRDEWKDEHADWIKKQS